MQTPFKGDMAMGRKTTIDLSEYLIFMEKNAKIKHKMKDRVDSSDLTRVTQYSLPTHYLKMSLQAQIIQKKSMEWRHYVSNLLQVYFFTSCQIVNNQWRFSKLWGIQGSVLLDHLFKMKTRNVSFSYGKACFSISYQLLVP